MIVKLLNNDYFLVDLSTDYIEEMVSLHNKAFEGFFLTTLGDNFLNTYYRSCIKNKDTISVGVCDDTGRLKGYAIGALNASGYHKKILLKNCIRFFTSLIIATITRPSILIRLFLNLNKSPKIGDIKDYAELLSIAVLPSLKGAGLGKLLLKNFESQAKAMGAKKCALTTDFYNNQTVLNFYKTNNYEIYYDFLTYPNRRMYKMIKDLAID